MANPNELFANMYRIFGLTSNPFLDALKGNVASNTSNASSISASNELFANMYRNFGLTSHPFLDALKGNVAQNTSDASSIPANLVGMSDMDEAMRQNLQQQLQFMRLIVSCTLESTEKLMELNLTAARTSIQENSTLATQVLESKSATDLQAIFAALPQATSTKAFAYGHHLTSITADACTGIAQSIHTQVPHIADRMASLIDLASRNMPAGSENVVALAKTAIATAGSSYEKAAKTAEHAAHTIQENAETVVNNAVERTAKATTGNNAGGGSH